MTHSLKLCEMIKDLQWISSLNDFGKHRYKNDVTTVTCLNMNTWSVAHRNDNYKDIFNKSLVLCDGFWANKLARLLGSKVDVLTGPDFFREEMLSKNSASHLILGATQSSLLGVKEYLKEIGVRKDIFIEPLPFCDIEGFDYEAIAKNIILREVDIVWVVLGAPKQEYFSSRLAECIGESQRNPLKGLSIIAVGAVVDFYSKDTEMSRAPEFYQRFGFEWAWRLRYQPLKTLKRILNEIFSIPIILFKELKYARNNIN